jgi:hypothetical protein
MPAPVQAAAYVCLRWMYRLTTISPEVNRSARKRNHPIFCAEILSSFSFLPFNFQVGPCTFVGAPSRRPAQGLFFA